jgi:hypothetical protein
MGKTDRSKEGEQTCPKDFRLAKVLGDFFTQQA